MGEEGLRVIVNPTAAAGAVGRDWPELRSFLISRGLRFQDVLTEAPGHATVLAREAVQEGYPTVLAVGGDGTVNEVVNGLFNGHGTGGRQASSTELAIMSRGTGCDLVRTLGSRDPKAVLASLTERDTTRPMDLGEIIMHHGDRDERRLFANVAGLGFDGEVVESLIRNQNAGKKMGGTVPYLLQVVRSIMQYDCKSVRASLDGEELNGVYTSFFTCNGRDLAGGMKIAPQADLSDGLFDIVVMDKMSRLGLLLRLPTLYVGWHTVFPEVNIRRGRELKVDTSDRVVIQADGELIGTAPATIRILPGALRVRV